MEVTLHQELRLDYMVNKASNASFTNAGFVDCRNDKRRWFCVTIGTAVTGSLSFEGSLDGGTTAFGIALPTDTLVHTSASGAALSGNTIALTAFTGTLEIGLKDPPRYMQCDLTRTSGGAAAGSSGMQCQTWAAS